MNLFFERIKGALVSSENFEAQIDKMRATLERYHRVAESPELAEYFKLQEVVTSPKFKEEKQRIVGRKYKDTEEGRKSARYKELSGSRQIKEYQRALESEMFRKFLEFRNSSDYGKLQDDKAVAASPELKEFKKINASRQYQNYLSVLNSDELRQLKDLEKEVITDDFKQRNAFWNNPNRWSTTEMAKQEERFNELAAMDDIKFFVKQNKEDIVRSEMYEMIVEDKMETLDNWHPGFGFGSDVLKDEFSMADEQQAYNGGKNTVAAVGRLDLELRQEPTMGLAWDKEKGFEKKLFPYSSDVMNSRGKIEVEEGCLIMAKVRSQGGGHHGFSLSTGKMKPLISVYFYNGNHHSVGIVTDKEKKQTDMRGVLRSKYFIYSIRWTRKEIIWYVNNLELLRIPNPLPAGTKMFFIAQSFLPAGVRPAPGKLKIAWLRVYKSKE